MNAQIVRSRDMASYILQIGTVPSKAFALKSTATSLTNRGRIKIDNGPTRFALADINSGDHKRTGDMIDNLTRIVSVLGMETQSQGHDCFQGPGQPEPAFRISYTQHESIARKLDSLFLTERDQRWVSLFVP